MIILRVPKIKYLVHEIPKQVRNDSIFTLRCKSRFPIRGLPEGTVVCRRRDLRFLPEFRYV